jgi:uroporphyrinogen-III synthase
MTADQTDGDESLVGFTVGITADRRWEEQAELLRRRGANILHGPSIRTLPLGSVDDLFEVTQRLIRKPPTVVVANTGIGMRTWLSAAESWGIGDALLHALGPANIFARGPKASAAVHQAGLDVAGRSPSERMAELLDLMLERDLRTSRIAFQCHGDESPEAIARLRDAGAEVIEVPIYRWILPQDTAPAEQLIRAAIERSVHAVTFTSAPAIRNLLIVAQEMECGAALLEALNTDVIAATVGPVCEAAARQAGITFPVTPDKWRLGPMIRTLSDALQATQQRTTLDGVPVALSGSTVFVAGTAVALSRRETELLRALLRRSPGFVTKRDLHLRIWGGAGDDHVVEVTVGRLRRKLGSPGAAVVSVPRRGYAVRA